MDKISSRIICKLAKPFQYVQLNKMIIKTYFVNGKTSEGPGTKTHGLNAFKFWQDSQGHLGHRTAQSDTSQNPKTPLCHFVHISSIKIFYALINIMKTLATLVAIKKTFV